MVYLSIAGYAFAAMAGIVCLFHLALILGAPWGAATMGGRYTGALPLFGRVISALSLLVVLAFAIIILEHTGLITVPMLQGLDWPTWTVVGYCVLGVIMHVATPSRIERLLWLPVVLIMFISSWITGWYGPAM